MAEEKKKSYSKPRIKTQKIELGVYGDYHGGGGDERSTTPIRIKDETGGANLDT